MSDDNTIDIIFSPTEEPVNTNKVSKHIDKNVKKVCKVEYMSDLKNNHKNKSLCPLISDTSLSFLENPFDNEIYTEINNTYLKLKEFENHDKLFFPKLLYERFDYANIEKISGEYLIHKTKNKEIQYLVVTYPISMTYDAKLLIVLGRKDWEIFIKKKQRKEYLESIKKGESYAKQDSIETERKRILNKQITEKLNFFFIETSNDLNIFVKSLNSGKSIKKAFKKFSKKKGKELFYALILSILGVNKLVAESIVDKFKDLKTFMEEAESTDFTKIEYFIKGNIKNITKAVEKNIKKFFFFESQNNFIYK